MDFKPSLRRTLLYGNWELFVFVCTNPWFKKNIVVWKRYHILFPHLLWIVCLRRTLLYGNLCPPHYNEKTMIECLRRTLLYGNLEKLHTIEPNKLMFKKNIVVWKL